jgi:alkylhydroperoxidase/carboxymuconolactone decarboxylase family protein YurZ
VHLPDPSGHRDVALGLCRSAGRILLVWNARSAQGTATRYWDLPGGSVRPGEPVKDALAREWEEEVGWTPSVLDLLLVSDGAKRETAGGPPIYTWRAFVFGVGEPPFGVMPQPGPEIEKIDFVADRDAQMRLLAPYHAPLRAFLADGPRYAQVSWVEASPAGDDDAGLPRDLRRLCVLSAAAAVGDAALVASETAAALAAGVPRASLEEALLQIVPYAGHPRALAAFAAARPALGPADPAAAHEAPRDTFPAAGDAAFATVYGDSAPRVRAGLGALHPLLLPWTLEHAYGRVLARPALPPPVREVLGVAILTALGGQDDALLGHARAALRLGVPRTHVDGAIAVVPHSAGDGKRAAARAVVARA